MCSIASRNEEAIMQWIHMVEVVLYLALAIILLCHLAAA
jgi:hypothetical protein